MLDIGVRVGGDIDPLKKELKKASQEIQSFSQTASELLRNAAKGFAVVATSATATGGAMLKLASDSATWAKALENLADLSQASAEEFQEMAFASKTLGIEQDKLADILKDVNERVGEFISTRSGPMKDFFEQIAPKIGVTINQFRRLSGPEALQLYYDSLEKAGVSQQEMTFYLEQMASDTTKLIPLLKNGGAEFKNLGKQARDAGAILSNEGVAALSDLSLKLDLLKSATAASGRAFAELLTPEVNTFVEASIKATSRLNELLSALKRSRENKQKQNELDEKSLAIIRQQSAETNSGTIAQRAAASALNDAMKNQITLREEVIVQERRLFAAVQTRNTVDQQAAQERLQQIVDEQKFNDEQIKFLRQQSAEAEKIHALRTATTEQIIEQVAAQEALNSVSSSGGGGYEDEFGPGFLRDPFDPNQTEGPKKARMDEFSFGEDDPFATEQELFAQHWEEMNRIAVEGAGGISQIMAQQWGNAVGSTAAAGKSMMESFSQSSRKMFEINKAWGIADAIVSTAQGIAAGVKLGWPMGIPAVAWAVANGAAQISRIRSTQFGGGGGTPTATTSAPAQGQAAPGTNALGGQESGRTLRIEGLRADSLYTGNQLQNLATNLEEFWNDGGGKGRVIFAGDK